MLRRVMVSVTDRRGKGVPDIDVCAISLARYGQIDEVEATETTDAAGVCYFDLAEPCHYRPMLSPMLKRELRVVPLNVGGQGIRKDFVVDDEGWGTHTTWQSAITAAIALGAGFEVVIYGNPGTYTEDVTVPFAGTDGHIYLVGEGAVVCLENGSYNEIVTIQGSAGGSTSVLEASGTGSIAALGINFKPKLGASAETLKIATSNDLELNECKVTSWAAGFTAVVDVRCRNCVISTGGRVIDSANQIYFEQCYLSGAGLIKGNWDTLVVNECILKGTAPAGEYWIHEDTLVVSRALYVTKCVSDASGGSGVIKFGDQSAISNDCIIAHNKINIAAGKEGIHIVELIGAVIADNIIKGANNADGSTAIVVAAGIGGACRACVVAHNSIRTIQNGIVVGAAGTDGTCVIGPNAYYDVGTAASGVPDAENYEVSTYTPTTAADWDGDADPGGTNDALDQLAERVTDLEEKGVYEFGSSTTTVFGESGVWNSDTPFTGTVNGVTTSTSVPYNHTAGEGSLTCGQVLHNTTKSQRVYIVSVNIAANTITVEANSPHDAAGWANLDALTTASQTNAGRGGVFVDIDITPHIIADSVPVACILQGYSARRNADTYFIHIHPYEAYDVDKEMDVVKQWQDDTLKHNTIIIPVVAADGRYYFTAAWRPLAADNAEFLFRWQGQFSALVA